jgi:hypothetical protein
VAPLGSTPAAGQRPMAMKCPYRVVLTEQDRVALAP